MTQAAQAPAVPGLWKSVGLLLRLRLVILVNSIKRAPLKTKIGWGLLGLLLLAFLGFLLFLAWLLLRFLNSPELEQMVGTLQPFMESLPGTLLGVVFLGTLLTSFGVLLQALYLAGDMDFLLSAPLPVRAVFISKLLQAVVPNFALMSLFALPVLWGLGAALGYNLLYYVFGPLFLAGFALAAAGISALLVMGVVRIAPPRRVAEVVGFVGAISSFICSQTGNLAQFGDFGEQEARQAVSVLERFNQPWSPLTWAGRGLTSLGEAEWLAGLGLTVLALGICGLVFGVSLAASEKLYITGWSSLRDTGRKSKAKRGPAHSQTKAASKPKAALTGWAEKYVPQALRALLVKDLLTLRRDIRNLSQLVMPLIFGGLYAFVFLRNPPQPDITTDMPPILAEGLSNLPEYINAGFSFFVAWMLATRLASIGFSQEGRQYWILKTAPLSARQMLLAKFLVAFVPSLALSGLFLVVLSLVQGAGLGSVLFGLLAQAMLIAGIVGINLAMGVVGANLEWEDPRHMTPRGGAGCLVVLISMAFVPVAFFLIYAPGVMAALLGWPEWVGLVAGLASGGIFCGLAAVVPPLMVRERVNRLGEA